METTTAKAKLTRVGNDNPFRGKVAMLTVLKKAYQATTESALVPVLRSAYNEIQTQQDFEMFCILLISIGDIQNREHRILKNTVTDEIDQGGNSLRIQFFWAIKWLVNTHPDVFFKLIAIIGEYTNIENLFYYQVRTDRKSGKLLEVRSIIPTDPTKRMEFLQVITNYLAYKISSSDTTAVEHETLAKYIHTPKFSTRKRQYRNKKGEVTVVRTPIKEHTREKESFEFELCKMLSEKLDWEVVQYPKNTRFLGIEKYKKLNLVQTESTLFASKEILDFNKEQFHNWLNRIPSEARYRVQKRLFNKTDKGLVPTTKWVTDTVNLPEWYTLWLNSKEAALETVKELQEKKKLDGLSTEEEKMLKQATKASKVNTGASTLDDSFVEFFLTGNKSAAEREIVIQSLLNNLTVNVPVFVVVDKSGSMSSPVVLKTISLPVINVAAFAAYVFLTKNPNAHLGNMLAYFDSSTKLVVDASFAATHQGNKFMATATTKYINKIIDPTKKAIENYNTVLSLLLPPSGYTDINGVGKLVQNWVVQGETQEEKERRAETFRAYQVILVISDSEFNNKGSAVASLLEMRRTLMSIGWDGVIVVWDVKGTDNNPFDDVENVIHLSGTGVGTLNTIFKNIHDIDVVDVYQPLLSLYRSNRYDPVKAALAQTM